ncbi:MAG TPA: phosphoribosylanthranilate isomerase [Methyloceanibacter sp.]|nr:phosphoribosylanthranilate isomerase [Methyloceanibacter sp.]
MAVKVKICGVRTPAIVETAAAEGADYVGLVIFEKSPRHVEVEEARVLAAIARGKIGVVAVLVDPDDRLLDQVADRVRPDVLQLHGSETPERVAAIKARTGLPVMKAIGVRDAADVTKAAAYTKIADMVLFDAKPAPDAAVPGGAGTTFDWTLLSGVALTAPFALSGGLNPDNVAEAVALTGASLVDVSSGVESALGEKDAGLVRRFVQAAKAAGPQARAKAS